MGGLGIIHRFNTIEKQINIVKKCIVNNKIIVVGAAIGAVGDFVERTQELLKNGINIICLDVAHGDSIVVKKALEKLNQLPNRKYFHLMVGNVATRRRLY